MPALRGSALAVTPGQHTRLTAVRDDEVRLTCLEDGCTWSTVRPARERVVWSAQEAHRIAHAKGWA